MSHVLLWGSTWVSLRRKKNWCGDNSDCKTHTLTSKENHHSHSCRPACLHWLATFSRMTCLWHHPRHLLATVLLLWPCTACQESHRHPTYQMLRFIISGSFLFPVQDSLALEATLEPQSPFGPHALGEICEVEWKSQISMSLHQVCVFLARLRFPGSIIVQLILLFVVFCQAE